MEFRVFFQLANGLVAALLLNACTQTGPDRPQTAAIPSPAVVAATPAAQPVLPVLKPGTKKRAPAKPNLDLDQAVPAPDATVPQDAAAGGGVAPPGAAGEVRETGGAAAETPSGEVPAGGADILPGRALPNPDVVTAEPEPVQNASTPHDTADDLRGQTEIQVMGALGSPSTTRTEGTSTIWSYRSGECGLDVYFFLDVADNQRRALSYEFTPNPVDSAAQQRCFLALKGAAGR
ncbi:MAG: hypothetical protein ACK4ZN_11575 [Oceanibaculum sp.]